MPWCHAHHCPLLPSLPVGIAEMYMGDKKVERIKLRGRRGFCKIALEEQVDGIVPVYYFGQSKVRLRA